jgi:hypothetical protein
VLIVDEAGAQLPSDLVGSPSKYFSCRAMPQLQIPLVARPRHQLHRHEGRPFPATFSFSGQQPTSGSDSPLSSIRNCPSLPVLVSTLSSAGSGAHADRAPAFRQSFRNRPQVRHFVTAQNPNDSCIAGARRFCDSQSFCDSFGTVGLLVVRMWLAGEVVGPRISERDWCRGAMEGTLVVTRGDGSIVTYNYRRTAVAPPKPGLT